MPDGTIQTDRCGRPATRKEAGLDPAAHHRQPLSAVGGFIALALDTIVQMFKPPFAFAEFLLQAWFVARVSILPT